MTAPRLIERKSVTIVLRGEQYEIYSLNIATLDKFKYSINSLIIKLFANLSKMSSRFQNQSTDNGKGLLSFLKPKKTSLNKLDPVKEILNTLTKELLELLEAASGLPHKFFDPKSKDTCLCLDELKALGEIIIEVNDLGFLVTALEKVAQRIKEN